MTRISFQQIVIGLVLVGAGLLAGAAVTTSNQALGEVRGTPPPQSFLSGGQLAVPVLKEISATLHQIDARLARLEMAAKELTRKRPRPSGNE